MKTSLRTIAILACLAIVAGCASHSRSRLAPALASLDFELDRVVDNFVYSEPDGAPPLSADLYLPQRSDLRPVVMTIHGGGWSARGREDMKDISLKLARSGYAVMNLSYRFAPGHVFPAQLHDVREALRWLVANAETYRLDTTRVNAWGYSSGAHLAALAAGYDPWRAEPATVQAGLPEIRAVVAGGIPADLRVYCDSALVNRFLGGDCNNRLPVYAEASPTYHVSPGDPPVFLYHGRLDMLVTSDQATNYYRALVEQGIDAELYLHALRGHTTMFLFGGEAEDRAIEFLNRQNG